MDERSEYLASIDRVLQANEGVPVDQTSPALTQRMRELRVERERLLADQSSD